MLNQLRKGRKGGMEKRKQITINSKIVDLSAATLIITLNFSGANTPTKRQTLLYSDLFFF